MTNHMSIKKLLIYTVIFMYEHITIHNILYLARFANVAAISQYTDLMYKYFYRVILFGHYTIYLLICNSLRKVIIQFSRNLHSFLIPIEREHLYVWVNHLVSLTLTCKSIDTWWNVVNTIPYQQIIYYPEILWFISLFLPCKKYYIH